MMLRIFMYMYIYIYIYILESRTPTLSIGSSLVSGVFCASCSGIVEAVVIECSLGITANIAGAPHLAKRRNYSRLAKSGFTREVHSA